MKRRGVFVSVLCLLCLMVVALTIPALAAPAPILDMSGAVAVAPAAPFSVDEALLVTADNNQASVALNLDYVIPETNHLTAALERQTITTYILSYSAKPDFLKVSAVWSCPLLFPIEAGAC